MNRQIQLTRRIPDSLIKSGNPEFIIGITYTITRRAIILLIFSVANLNW